MTALTASTTMSIDAIQIVDRHRRDLGSIDGLRDSIAERGLLHPVVVTPAGRLVAGERRLAACAQLGWTEVPVTIADSLGSASALLAAERDENTCRLDMSPSEKVALGRALEELERPAAHDRMTLGKISTGSAGRTREIVGSAVGMSGPTYERAKVVVDRAAEGDANAAEALAEMDRTGKVTPAYEKVTGRSTEGRKIAEGRKLAERRTPAKKSLAPIETERGQQQAKAHARRCTDLISGLRGYAEGIENLDITAIRAAMEPAELAEWTRSLGDSLKKLNRFRSDLKESGN